MNKKNERSDATFERVNPPLKWHGGKYYLAKEIVARLPQGTTYCEPYGGGLSVLLARDPEGSSEVVNDIHAALQNFWTVLRSEALFASFERRAQATPFSEEIWKIASEFCQVAQKKPREDWPQLSPEDKVLSAWAFFVCCRMSLAGRMDSFTGITKTRTRRGMNNEVSAWLSAVEGLPAVHERLRRVLVLNRDALEVIAQLDHPETVTYLDPPYMDETRVSPKVYQHEMSRADHAQLLSLLAKVKGKFLLSGYRSQLYDDAADVMGWSREDFTLPNAAAGGSSKRLMTESLWYNF